MGANHISLINLNNYERFHLTFDASQSEEDLKRDIESTIEAEKIILKAKGERIVHRIAGYMGDDFAQNKITLFIYHTKM